jgi:hypothetical protein
MTASGTTRTMKTRTQVGCTVDVGNVHRVLRKENSSRTYYELLHMGGVEIVWCKRSFDAFNIGVNRYGRNFLNMTNLETERLVMGATR